jgi:hypothetical protein
MAVPIGLAAASFLLAFLQQPGQASSDTKIDLHVDPGGFLGDVASLWTPTANATSSREATSSTATPSPEKVRSGVPFASRRQRSTAASTIGATATVRSGRASVRACMPASSSTSAIMCRSRSDSCTIVSP